MASQFCTETLKELTQLVYFHGSVTLTLCVLHLSFTTVATLGNVLVIHALLKTSSIPANIRKLFLSLAFSDLAVGLFAQLMFGVIFAVMLRMTANGNYKLDFLCPTTITVCYFSLFMLACVSFITVTAITVDRFLVICFHLRYQELVTSTRVIIALVILWLTSGVAASIFISLPNHSRIVTVTIQIGGVLFSTVAYIRIFKVVRYHRNQIQSQQQLSTEAARELIREKKSAFNAVFFYAVFIGCYLPYLCSLILSVTNRFGMTILAANHVTVFLVLLNSSLNPIVYCWRYKEVRGIVKSTLKRIFRITDT